MSKLMFTVGISGSGKSTFCEKFIKENPEVIYLSSDFVRGVLGKDESDQSVSAETFRFLETAVHYFLKQNKTVLVDATFTHKRSRENIIKIARFLGKKIVCYYFDVPLNVCMERNKGRKREVPNHVILRQFENLTLPIRAEVDFVYYVNGIGEVESYSEKI